MEPAFGIRNTLIHDLFFGCAYQADVVKDFSERESPTLKSHFVHWPSCQSSSLVRTFRKSQHDYLRSRVSPCERIIHNPPFVRCLSRLVEGAAVLRIAASAIESSRLRKHL